MQQLIAENPQAAQALSLEQARRFDTDREKQTNYNMGEMEDVEYLPASVLIANSDMILLDEEVERNTQLSWMQVIRRTTIIIIYNYYYHELLSFPLIWISTFFHSFSP